MTWRDRARTVAYEAYDQLSDGPGLHTRATAAAQLIAAADTGHTGASTVAAGLAIAVMVADRFVAIPDPDIVYAGFDTDRK